MTITEGRVSAFTDDALGRDDMVGLLERLERREVSAAELHAAATGRAHAVNAELNAVMCWVDEPAVGVATDGALAGVPTVVKDNEALAGYPTSDGSNATSTRPAAASSPWVAHALALGLSPVAKTALSEFGLTATTETLRNGATRNPWNVARSTGGSSGGTAALVAAGVVPFGHGNDGGGSIRIPASCCGLVGLKPTRGRLPDIAVPVPVDITVQGVLTRTVRDTARYYAEAERTYPVADLPPIGLVEGPSATRLRVGLVTVPPMGLPVSDEAVAAVQSTADLLSTLGHEIVEVAHPVDDSFGPDFLRYWGLLAGLIRVAGLVDRRSGFDGSRIEPFTRDCERWPATTSRSTTRATSCSHRCSLTNRRCWATWAQTSSHEPTCSGSCATCRSRRCRTSPAPLPSRCPPDWVVRGCLSGFSSQPRSDTSDACSSLRSSSKPPHRGTRSPTDPIRQQRKADDVTLSRSRAAGVRRGGRRAMQP